MDGLKTPTQELLKRSGDELADYRPGGILAKGSGGKGMATYTPWIGFFDPDETSDPQEGMLVFPLVTYRLIREERAMATRDLGFPVFDADNHIYETRDALTKYLPEAHKHAIDFVEVHGRTKITACLTRNFARSWGTT